jgi:hypothetical protein
MLVDQLDQAERRVVQGAEHVARQRMLVKHADCQARTQARELLAQFEEMQQMHIVDRDRLRAKLAAVSDRRHGCTDRRDDEFCRASRDALTAMGTNSPVRI